MPVEAPTVPVDAHFYRWRDAMAAHAPAMPLEVLEAFYQHPPTTDGLADILGCDAETAQHWHALASVWLLDPRLYAPLFQAEDQMADLRSQRTAFLAECKQMEDRLSTLDEQIAISKNYGLLSEAHGAEVAPKIEAMDEERLTLLRAMERDVPRQRELLQQEEREVQDRLHAAQNALQAAFAVQVDRLHAQWLEEALGRVEPILEVLRKVGSLDEAWKVLGRPGLSASATMTRAVVRELQG